MGKNTANLYPLSDRAFAIVGDDGLTNFGIVRGDDGSALLIDGDIRRMDEIEHALQSTGCRSVRYHLNTHENFDHSSANQYFEKNGAVIIGSDGCWEALKEDGEAKFAEMAGRTPELWERYPDLQMGQVQITFAQSLSLRLPGVEVQIHFAAHNRMSHSRGDAIAVLENERILFAGDLLYTDYHPVTVYGDIPNWLQSIGHLLGKSFDWVVPGHGPVSQGAAAYKAAFEKFREYLADFHGRLLEAEAGKKSVEEVASHMRSGVYAHMGKTWMVKRNIEYFLKGRK